MSEQHTTDYNAGYRDALDDVETRIRYQMIAAPIGSMEWRAHIADITHVEAIRVALTRITPTEEPQA